MDFKTAIVQAVKGDERDGRVASDGEIRLVYLFEISHGKK